MGVKSNGALLGHPGTSVTLHWDGDGSGAVQCWNLPRHGLGSDNSNEIQWGKIHSKPSRLMSVEQREKIVISSKKPSVQDTFCAFLLECRLAFSRENGFLPKIHRGFTVKGRRG